MDPSDELVPIDLAKSPFEARIILSILESAGIKAFVDGANLQDEFAISQALMNNVGVRITVRADQLDDALAAIEAARSTPLDPAVYEAVPPEEPPPAGRRSMSGVLGFLLALVFLVLWLRASNEAAALRGPNGLFRYEVWDQKGVRTYWGQSDRLYAEQLDADGNGHFERSTFFNRDGQRITVSHDLDQDGIAERVEVFLPGRDQPVARYLDRDQDGIQEEWVQFHPGGSRAVWHDRDRDGVYELRDFFDADGKLTRTDENRGAEGFVRR